MDFKNKVDSLQSVNMTDPFAPNVKPLIEQVRNYNFFSQIYPDSVVQELPEAAKDRRNLKPPKCIFLPHDDLVRTMVKAVAKFGNREHSESFFLRFGLLDDPNWYLER